MQGLRAAWILFDRLKSLTCADQADDLLRDVHKNLKFAGFDIIALDRTIKTYQIGLMTQKERDKRRERMEAQLNQVMTDNYLTRARNQFAQLEKGFHHQTAGLILDTIFERLDKAKDNICALDATQTSSLEDIGKRLETAWQKNMQYNMRLKSLDDTRFAMTYHSAHYVVAPPAQQAPVKRHAAPPANGNSAPQASGGYGVSTGATGQRIPSRTERMRQIQFEQLKMKIARKANGPK